MKKLLSLLIIATIITSSLCVSYFAIDDNSTQNNTESTTVPVTETSSTVTTEPVTESSTDTSSTEPTDIKVTSINLNTDDYVMYSKQYVQLKATVSPDNATNNNVTWKSSNRNVATVDKNGKVVAKRRGTCTITVSATDGSGVKAVCKVTVKQLVTSIKLNKSVINLNKKGDKATLKATIKPNNADNKKVTWSVQYPKNVRYNAKKGIVKASRNSCYSWVFVKASDGSKKGTKVLVVVGRKANKVEIGKTIKQKVKVKKGKKSKKKTINKFVKLKSMNITSGKSFTFSKKVTAKNNKSAVYGGVTWKSSNPKVLTIDNKGKIKAIKLGSVNVTATTMDGSKKSVKCKVRVIKPVKKITFDKKNKYNVNYGKSINLKATVEPSDASIKALKWKSSNSKVLTVNQKGKVTAKGLGSAVITASAIDGSGVKVKHRVSVNIPLNKKLTVKQIKSKYTMKKLCGMLNNYFKSCGAKIEPRLRGTHQWYVSDTQGSCLDGYDSINDIYIDTLGYWIQEMSGDFLNNDIDWNNKGYLEDSNKYADFLKSFEYKDKYGVFRDKKELVLNSKYNGFDWLINVFSKKDPISIYVDFEKDKINGKDYKDNKGNQEYIIKFYYDWQSNIDGMGWDKLKD